MKRKVILPKQTLVPQVARDVYRIPMKRVFKKEHVVGDYTWEDVYGKQKCCKCKQHFKEGEAYVVANGFKKLVCKHVECPPKPVRVKK